MEGILKIDVHQMLRYGHHYAFLTQDFQASTRIGHFDRVFYR